MHHTVSHEPEVCHARFREKQTLGMIVSITPVGARMGEMRGRGRYHGTWTGDRRSMALKQPVQTGAESKRGGTEIGEMGVCRRR